MADQKLTALNAITAATTDDILYIVDDPLGTPVSRKITFDNLQKSITTVASIASTGDIRTAGDKYLYFGDSTTDGSWRIFVDSGNLSFQKRVGGNWLEKGLVTT